MIRRSAAAQGRTHAGLVYSSPRRFPRDRRFAGALVVALERMIASGQVPGANKVGWLT